MLREYLRRKVGKDILKRSDEITQIAAQLHVKAVANSRKAHSNEESELTTVVRDMDPEFYLELARAKRYGDHPYLVTKDDFLDLMGRIL